MIDGSVLQSAQKCFKEKSQVVLKMVITPPTHAKKELLGQ